MHAFTDRFQRRPIHTCTKFLVHQGILPAQYLAQLSRSQVSRYRNLDFDRYFGNDLFRFSDQVMTITRQAAQNDFDRKMMQAYLRLALTFRSIFVHARHFHHTLHMHREKVVEAVQRVGDTISVDDCARLLGVATSTLRNWITQVRVRCSDSLINLCRKVHPNQLLGSEVEVMKELLSDNRLRFWPSVSVYYHALRTQSVSMAKSTWYKYAAMLNIRRLKPKRSHKYGQGIRASKPNQYWHADVTYFKSGDGLKHYIYTVVDNFSRFPLCVHLSTQLSGAIRSMTFRMALQKAMEYHPNLQTINLVVDGGPENINTNVEVFIKEVVHIPIHRIRSLKYVAFSNSMA